MNTITQMLDRLVRATGRRYANGEISRDEMIAYQIRVERLKDRSNWLKLQRRSNVKTERRRRQIALVRDVIARGGTIAAFDTEFSNEGPVEQLGISVWQNGTITTHTYTLQHLLDWYSNRPSLHGQDSTITRAEMKRIAAEVYAAADVNVFHSFGSDAEKLSLNLASAPFVDTCRLFNPNIIKGGVPGLRDICAFYEIPLDGHHNAGNDAYHTLCGLLKIAADTWDEDLSGDPDIIAQRDANRKLMMHPTRLPVPDQDELNRVRKVAHAAYQRFCDRERKGRKFVRQQSGRKERRESFLASLNGNPSEKHRAFRGGPSPAMEEST